MLCVTAELVNVLEWWSGTECTLFTDQATVDRFGKEHAIIILNHNYEIDFLGGWTMSERYGVLGVSTDHTTSLGEDRLCTVCVQLVCVCVCVMPVFFPEHQSAGKV